MLPFCADPRHPEDTLFFVFEEDWRLNPWDCKGTEGLVEDDMPPWRGVELTAPPSLAAIPKTREQDAKRKKVHGYWRPVDLKKRQEIESEPTAGCANYTPEEMGWYSKMRKPASVEWETVSTELVDMVKLFNASAKAGARDLLWMSWNASTKTRKEVPAYGSHLIALTARCARVLHANFDDWIEQGHFSISLKKALESHDVCRAELTAGFLFPALGHYEEHESGTISGVRESSWNARWVQGGTRPDPTELANYPKDWIPWQIRDFCPSGVAPHLGGRPVLLEDEDEDLTWWTAAVTVDESWYGSRHGRNILLSAERVRQMESGAHSPDAKVGVDPDTTWGEIRISQAQIAHSDEVRKHTQSWRRQHRAAVSLFEKRQFTNNPKKAPHADVLHYGLPPPPQLLFLSSSSQPRPFVHFS